MRVTCYHVWPLHHARPRGCPREPTVLSLFITSLLVSLVYRLQIDGYWFAPLSGTAWSGCKCKLLHQVMSVRRGSTVLLLSTACLTRCLGPVDLPAASCCTLHMYAQSVACGGINHLATASGSTARGSLGFLRWDTVSLSWVCNCSNCSQVRFKWFWGCCSSRILQRPACSMDLHHSLVAGSHASNNKPETRFNCRKLYDLFVSLDVNRSTVVYR